LKQALEGKKKTELKEGEDEEKSESEEN